MLKNRKISRLYIDYSNLFSIMCYCRRHENTKNRLITNQKFLVSSITCVIEFFLWTESSVFLTVPKATSPRACTMLKIENSFFIVAQLAAVSYVA